MSFIASIRQNLQHLLLIASLPSLLSAPALARSDGPFSLEVLVDGQPLEEYNARGTTYVEARRGHEYALRLSNRTGGRIAVALSVDGLNTIDARTTAARDASKWVLGPYETVVISGWQTDTRTARQFFFTSEDRSYGAWLGKTANLGVIAAEVFRERAVAYARPPEVLRGPPRERNEAASPESKAAGAAKRDMPQAETDSELAATGSGRVVGHEVERVTLDLEQRPSARFELRYEYHDALVKLGVLPKDPDSRALARRERARGFEDGFCPDPGR